MADLKPVWLKKGIGLSMGETALSQLTNLRFADDLLIFASKPKHLQLLYLLMQQGGAAQYKEIMQRIEDSKVAHEREVNRLKIKRRQRQKLLKELGTYAIIGLLSVSFLLGALFIYVELFM